MYDVDCTLSKLFTLSTLQIDTHCYSKKLKYLLKI